MKHSKKLAGLSQRLSVKVPVAGLPGHECVGLSHWDVTHSMKLALRFVKCARWRVMKAVVLRRVGHRCRGQRACD